MSRSLKKGPFIDVKLEKRILAMNETNKKSVVKTWARYSMISPEGNLMEAYFPSLATN